MVPLAVVWVFPPRLSLARAGRSTLASQRRFD